MRKSLKQRLITEEYTEFLNTQFYTVHISALVIQNLKINIYVGVLS